MCVRGGRESVGSIQYGISNTISPYATRIMMIITQTTLSSISHIFGSKFEQKISKVSTKDPKEKSYLGTRPCEGLFCKCFDSPMSFSSKSINLGSFITYCFSSSAILSLLCQVSTGSKDVVCRFYLKNRLLVHSDERLTNCESQYQN